MLLPVLRHSPILLYIMLFLWGSASAGLYTLGMVRLGEIFAPWFAERTLAGGAEELDAHGACWGPYRTCRQMLDEDPRCSTGNPMFAEADQPGVGGHLVPGSPLAFGGPEATERGAVAAPRLG